LQQLGVSQTLDSTVKKFTALNSTVDALSSGFSKLTNVLPGAAGGKPTGGAGSTALPQGGPGGDLSGLKIKSGEATAGGPTSQSLAYLGRTIQEKLGGDLKHFSAFNDSYHQGTDSAHTKGKALDFTLNDPTKAAQVAAIVRGLPGVKSVRDEYSNPSSRSTAGHIHAEINGAAGFRGMLSGPMSGYRPNVLMHGNEELSIKPMGRPSTDVGSGGSDMSELVSEIRELVSIGQRQLSTAQKILKYQQ
jgi:hypothetical protein